jgi:hypothetical protein
MSTKSYKTYFLFLILILHFWKSKICKSKSVGCSFKLILKVGVEESILNAPRITDHGSAV